MGKYLDEATQALARVCFIPPAHARTIVEALDDTTRESLHLAMEQVRHNMLDLVDAAQQELKPSA